MNALKKKHPWNILILPAASEVGLEICRALRDCKEVILHGANQPGQSLADFYFQKVHVLPRIDQPEFWTAAAQLIHELKIDAIFPAHDEVIETLGQNPGRLAVPVMTSTAGTCRVCRSKKRTYEILRGVVPVPEIIADAHANKMWPRFAKPECGQGSRRARRFDDAATLQAALAAEPDLLVTEYLPGAEYTVDCFSQPGRGLLYAQARERRETKAGIAVRTSPVELEETQNYAAAIDRKIPFTGAWFFQLKAAADGTLKILEVAPRIAGSSALSHALGPNLPLLSLYVAAGYDVEIAATPAPDLMLGRGFDVKFIDNRPMAALYVDYDDTLIVRGAVNTRLVALIFNCRNRQIPVKLITRHAGDLQASLTQHRLAGLFDQIIHIIDPTQPKAPFITEPDAVLIDDSFRERQETAKTRGIRCYDPAAALSLLDERI